MVEAKGIEPSSLGCEPSALPLSYTPTSRLAEATGVEPARPQSSSEFESGAITTLACASTSLLFECHRSGRSTAGAAHPRPSGTRVANAAVSKTHVLRRGGRRTRTFLQALYRRGHHPVVCPRNEESRPRLAWGGSISVLLNSRYMAAPFSASRARDASTC